MKRSLIFKVYFQIECVLIFSPLLNIRILTIQLRLVLIISKHCALKAVAAGAKLTPLEMLKKSAN